MMISLRGKKRDHKRIKEYNRKKIEDAKQTQREIAQMKKSHENVERSVADLKEKHYSELTVIELDRLQDLRKLEAVIDCRESELWKQNDLVEELKQELDDRDAELDEIDDALAKSRERYDRHTSYWRGLLDDVRGGKYR